MLIYITIFTNYLESSAFKKKMYTRLRRWMYKKYYHIKYKKCNVKKMYYDYRRRQWYYKEYVKERELYRKIYRHNNMSFFDRENRLLVNPIGVK